MKINEKLGIPEGISRASDKLYTHIAKCLGHIDVKEDMLYLNKNNCELELFSLSNITIADFKIKEANIKIKFIRNSDVEHIELYGAAVKQTYTIGKNGNNIVAKPSGIETIDIDLKIVTNDLDNIDIDGVIEMLNKNDIKSVLSHELMHIFDSYKTQQINIEDVGDYHAISEMPYISPIIGRFMHLLYFVTNIETAVYPSELYQSMVGKNITKVEFKGFIKKHRIMKILNAAIDFRYNDLKKEVESDLVDVYDKEVDDVMEYIFNMLSKSSTKTVMMYLRSYVERGDSIMGLMGLMNDGDDDETDTEERAELADKKLEVFINRFRKYENNMDGFFLMLQKKINLAGITTKKKLYKLYDMAADDKRTSTKSIINWDLHQKINSKNEKLDTNSSLSFEEFRKSIKYFRK